LRATLKNTAKRGADLESTMTKHPAVPVPKVPGIDPSDRPSIDFGPLPLEVRVLSRSCEVRGFKFDGSAVENNWKE